ncbi:DENN domain containing protein [Neofusicoccum parvum]|uniref:DENN domain containing protein n=1 Tax=Neofusicoccum parvum TaxID=310453 RepID=A0ACB5SCA6_9PEZI|nr:DENN domain containing protein [Neofusicoccum parvum]
MAPAPPAADPANVPLADYFFISGIESSQVYDAQRVNGAAVAPVESTIEEDAALEVEEEATPTPPRPTSSDGLSLSKRASHETRQSISSVIGPDSGPGPTASNRSSATIKGFPQIGGSGLTDFDFDQALRKFAAERETFLEEIQFSAGTLKQEDRPRPRPKTQRIVSEDASSLGAGIGSIRRRISTIGRSQRNSSVMRNSSIRTSRRMSGYNSVIPAPRPFLHTPNMHPLKRRYEPVLLDRYPPKAMVDELKRRNPFPDYVPMFAFPNDVNVVSSDERPRSTWHGFAMTNGDGSKLHGICLTVWVPLNPVAAEELERQCEEWRKANMTPEERELAGSLGERLAAERAKLSRLLAQLPTVPSGSEERERLEDDISAVEEKIGLMNDLLRPVRHGAASKIDGLTDGDTGLWIPRAYGVLGRDGGMTSFWKEWLRAVVVPMYQGSILRVPASSPRIGMWQPLERYVINLCAEALSPMSSITQVELAVRELRMYARKEAANELPGSRNTDIYALFRSLSIQNIVTLFEYVLSEGRIILLSSHTSMLHLVSAAITHLLYPFKWAGVFIPVLPVRLIQALEAPCPYIVGIERRYENVELPEDDFVLVDLDQDVIESTAPPVPLPRQQRRKLISLLQLAAPHHIKYGVSTGPPAYAIEAYPYDSLSSENTAIFTHKAPRATLAHYFGPERMNTLRRPSQPFLGHSSNLSTSTLGADYRAPGSSYAPSVYAQSTLAASTVMPNAFSAPVRNTDTTQWCEGHCMQWRPNEEKATCSICDEKAEDGIYRCTGCSVISHPRCLNQICLVCPSVFQADQKKSGLLYSFNMDGFLRSMPSENQEYFAMLRETQGK